MIYRVKVANLLYLIFENGIVERRRTRDERKHTRVYIRRALLACEYIGHTQIQNAG